MYIAYILIYNKGRGDDKMNSIGKFTKETGMTINTIKKS